MTPTPAFTSPRWARFGLSLAAVAALCAATACGESKPVHQDVRYDERHGESTSLDVFEPDGEGPHPAVMLIHGGAFVSGDKSAFHDTARRLADAGYVAASINYRLIPDGQYPRLVQDAYCALSFLRANASTYHIDPDRIAVWGYSAGGYLASLVGVGADDPLHVPDCKWGKTAAPRAVVSAGSSQDARGEDRPTFFGGTRAEVPGLYASASPITHVGPNKPAYLFVYGTDDWFVAEEESKKMSDMLTAAGNDSSVFEESGGGHIFQTTSGGQLQGGTSDRTPASFLAVLDFLDRTTARRQ